MFEYDEVSDFLLDEYVDFLFDEVGESGLL